MWSAIEELEQRRKAGTLSNEDADLLKEYLLILQADRNMTDRGLLTEFRMIAVWAYYFKFSTMTLADIRAAKSDMDSRGLKPNTMRGYLHRFKRFVVWCVKEKGFDIDLEKLANFKLPKIDKSTKTKAAMLSQDEIREIINAARQPRDKAIFSILYEGGLRPVEIVTLNWGDVKFDEHGAVINTSEKTGMPRYIRLLSSSDYLARWQASTPGKRGPNDPVFITVNAPHRRISYSLMQYQLKDLAKKAKVGINKKTGEVEKEVSLYLFRHSRITHMMEKKIPESVIKLQHWGSLDTNMLSTYAHVDGAHIDEVLLDQAKIKKARKREERDAMAPVQCPACSYINVPGSHYCSACGVELTEKTKAKKSTMLDVLSDMAREDPEGLIEALKKHKKL